MSKKWRDRAICGCLVLVTIAGAAAAAGTQGSQSDPLVTLSYLNEKFLPELLSQVDAKVAEKTKTLSPSAGNAFVNVEIGKGKTLTVKAGTQLLLRSGAAVCDELLLDSTKGETVGGPLQKDHLYIALKDKEKVVISEKASFMILGSYSE